MRTFAIIVSALIFCSLKGIFNNDSIKTEDKTKKMTLRIGGRNLLIGIPPAMLKAEVCIPLKKDFKLNVGVYYSIMYKIGEYKFFSKDPYTEYSMSSAFFTFFDGLHNPSNKWWYQPPAEHFSFYANVEKILFPSLGKKLSHWNISGSVGIGYVDGYIAGKMLYYTIFDFLEQLVYYYEVIRYKNISADISVRINSGRRWSLSLFYSYIPAFSEYKRVFSGWLWEYSFQLGKRRKEIK